MPVLDMPDTVMDLAMLLLTDTDTTARDPLRPMLDFSMEDTDMVLDLDTPVLDMPDTVMDSATPVLDTDTVLDTTARDLLMLSLKPRLMLDFSMEDMDMVLDSDTPVLAMVMVDTVLDTEVSTMVKKQYFKAHKSSNAICLQFSACFGR